MKNSIKAALFVSGFLYSMLTVGLAQELPPAEPNKLPAPKANLMIVNATGVSGITVKIGGQEMYTDFHPGEKTSGGSFKLLETQYEVIDPVGKVSYVETIKMVPNSFQSLIIMGDFNEIEGGATGIRGENQTKSPYKDVAYLLLSHELSPSEKAYRYRFVNAISGKAIICRVKGGEEVTVGSGQTHSFSGKPLKIDFEVVEGKNVLPLSVNQEGIVHNATFVIYETDGALKFIPLPEETAATLSKRE